MSELTVGKRLHSAACHTEIIVIRAPQLRTELSCAGAPMGAAEAARSATSAGGADHGVVLGKRYVDEQTGLEVLCTKAGAGPLVARGQATNWRVATPPSASSPCAPAAEWVRHW
jgi:hypothetical protein